MAYSAERFNENAAGMTGFGHIAYYDGSGRDAAAATADNPDEGGDLLATIRGNGFFPMTENGAPSAVYDAVRIASRGPARPLASGDVDYIGQTLASGDVDGGATIAQSYDRPETGNPGLPIILRGNDGVEINELFEWVGNLGSPPVRTRQLRVRNAGWRHT